MVPGPSQFLPFGPWSHSNFIIWSLVPGTFFHLVPKSTMSVPTGAHTYSNPIHIFFSQNYRSMRRIAQLDIDIHKRQERSSNKKTLKISPGNVFKTFPDRKEPKTRKRVHLKHKDAHGTLRYLTQLYQQ